jgi:DNA modification methylase
VRQAVEYPGYGKLICGDALDVLRGMESGSVHMIWTDPPYGHGNMQGDLQAARVRDGVKGGRVAVAEPIANDTPEEFRELMSKALPEFGRVLDSDCCCCCCCCGGGGPKPTFGWFSLEMDKDPLTFFHAIVWDKSGRGDGLGWRYRRNYEFVMVSHRKGGKLRWNEDHKAIPNIMRDTPPINRVHPNEKPFRLVQRFIQAHTKPGDIILDPFMGSGTTCVAAAMEGRKFIGVELDPKYFEIARRRVEHCIRPGMFAEVES